MSGIRGKDTKPELAIRSALQREGFRFRLHRKDLPGKPDLLFPRYKAVLFVHGCFWHGHDCHLFRWPSTREDFWYKKITGNRLRFSNQQTALFNKGWRVAIIWECALKGKSKLNFNEVVSACTTWLNSDKKKIEIKGKETRISA